MAPTLVCLAASLDSGFTALIPSHQPLADVKGGSGGKAALLPVPPRARQRNLIYGIAGPQGLRFHMRPQGAVKPPGGRMMEMPLGFRVSGPFRRKGPIKNVGLVEPTLRLPKSLMDLQMKMACGRSHFIYEVILLRSITELTHL